MDAYIDPTTKDYVLLSGLVKRDPANGLLNACYLRLTVELNSYWDDPTFGSLLYTLRREKASPRLGVLAEQYASQALAPILADGRATQINVSSQTISGVLYLLFEVIAASGESLTFKHPVTVG